MDLCVHTCIMQIINTANSLLCFFIITRFFTSKISHTVQALRARPPSLISWAAASTAVRFVYITQGWRHWRIYSLYAIKMHFKHLVMMEKHCNHFAMFIISIMQVCNHKSVLYFVFNKNNVVASLSIRQWCPKILRFYIK